MVHCVYVFVIYVHFRLLRKTFKMWRHCQQVSPTKKSIFFQSRFSAQWNVPWRFQSRFQSRFSAQWNTPFSQNFSERALLVLKNSITISIRKIGIVESVTLKKPCLFHADFNYDFNHDFNHDFLHSGTWLADFNHDLKHDFNHENRHSGTGYIEIAVLVPCRFQSRFQ